MANALKAFEEEHPLQWLQATPELSACAAIYLPPLWRQPCFEGEALSNVSTSASERGCVSQKQCWADAGMKHSSATEAVNVPPQLTPCISSLPPPPPPPAHIPMEMPSSLLALQTPSPAFAYATSMPFQRLAAREPQTSEQPLPTLLATAGTFAALNAWSTTCDGASPFSDESRAMGMAQADEGVEATMLELTSVGSALHELGSCKPCAFVHRPAGCADGTACQFCHLCGPGEKKRRQKQKFERIQQRRLRRASATSASPAELTGDCRSFALSPGTPAPR